MFDLKVNIREEQWILLGYFDLVIRPGGKDGHFTGSKETSPNMFKLQNRIFGDLHASHLPSTFNTSMIKFNKAVFSSRAAVKAYAKQLGKLHSHYHPL